MNFAKEYASRLEKSILIEEMVEYRAEIEFNLARIAEAQEKAYIFTIEYNEAIDHHANKAESIWGFRFKEDMPYVNYSIEDVLNNWNDCFPDYCLTTPYFPFGAVYPFNYGKNPLFRAKDESMEKECDYYSLFSELDKLLHSYPSLFIAIVSSFTEENVKLVEREYSMTLSEESTFIKDTSKGAKRHKALIKEKAKLHAYHEKTGRYTPSSYNRKGYKKEYMKDSYKRGNRKVRKEFDLPSGKSGWKKLGSCTCVW